MSISIIIPTLNEAENIGQLIIHLIKHGGNRLREIIIVDANSNDNTQKNAAQAGAKVLLSQHSNRAIQMNIGAKEARGDILYFVHADTFPPPSFAKDIEQASIQNYVFGRYRSKYNSSNLLLKINAFFTRFNIGLCKGGDQSLFIIKDIFEKHNGFNEQYCIMEEYEFQSRIGKQYNYKIIPKEILISARKYEKNSYLNVQIANTTIFKMYKKGVPPSEMLTAYRKMLS